MTSWTLRERDAALEKAGREGVDMLVVGGGIIGAGILRDAASRGLSALLVEKEDFASGTSGGSSKLIHGGLRYIGQGQLSVTREACAERDRLRRLNPNLIRPMPFIFPVYENHRMSLWKGVAMLFIYAALANFRATSRFRILPPGKILKAVRNLRREGLKGGGTYCDAAIDDARLVLLTLQQARALGAEAVNHAEAIDLISDGKGRVTGALIRDGLAGRKIPIGASVVINATGAGVGRIRSLHGNGGGCPDELRPAKGIHLVIPRRCLPVDQAVLFEAADGRYLFLIPWQDMAILGTTDTFTDQIAEPAATGGEVRYLLDAANRVFPEAGLREGDICSAYAGVRPLVQASREEACPSSVSREERFYRDPSGLISVAGGKLTTYRLIAEQTVDMALAELPGELREKAGPSRTAELPLRADRFDGKALIGSLGERFGLDDQRADHLVRTYGEEAAALLEESPPELRRPIGNSRYLYAEILWSIRTECPATLCDLLEHRIRLALFAEGQGLSEIDSIAALAGEAAGWDQERIGGEIAAYREKVRRRYRPRQGEGEEN
jgi:glycerol-3-phosphate dehydrogenase